MSEPHQQSHVEIRLSPCRLHRTQETTASAFLRNGNRCGLKVNQITIVNMNDVVNNVIFFV